MITACGLLYPMMTEWTLLQLLSFNKFHKSIIILVFFVTNLILLTALTLVKDHSTVQAIVLLANGTIKIYVLTLFENKRVVAIHCGTP
jgi:hypothetical protein